MLNYRETFMFFSKRIVMQIYKIIINIISVINFNVWLKSEICAEITILIFQILTKCPNISEKSISLYLNVIGRYFENKLFKINHRHKLHIHTVYYLLYE